MTLDGSFNILQKDEPIQEISETESELDEDVRAARKRMKERKRAQGKSMVNLSTNKDIWRVEDEDYYKQLQVVKE